MRAKSPPTRIMITMFGRENIPSKRPAEETSDSMSKRAKQQEEDHDRDVKLDADSLRKSDPLMSRVNNPVNSWGFRTATTINPQTWSQVHQLARKASPMDIKDTSQSRPSQHEQIAGSFETPGL